MTLYLSKYSLSCITAPMLRAAWMYCRVPFSASAASSDDVNLGEQRETILHLQTGERVQTLRQIPLRRVQLGNASWSEEESTPPLADHLHQLLGMRGLLLDLDDASVEIADRLLRLVHVRLRRTTHLGLFAYLDQDPILRPTVCKI